MKISNENQPETTDNLNMKARYQKAQTLMRGIWNKSVVRNATVFPTWIGQSDCFWYERQLKDGKEYRLVNAKTATNEEAFDHAELAVALTAAVGQEVRSSDLPINNLEIELEFSTESTKATLKYLKTLVKGICFIAFNKKWRFETQSKICAEIETVPEDWVVSPDGKQAVFTRYFNLWVRNLSSGEERALTQDGEEDYAYGAIGEAWGNPPGHVTLQVIWSPDSNKIFTVQRDKRQVKNLPLVHHVPQDGSLRPTVSQVKIAYPGDEHVPTLRLLIINIAAGQSQAANYRPIPATRNDWGLFSSRLGWWATDSRRAYFVDMERDYKTVRLVELNTLNGTTKVLFEETSETQINLMLNGDEVPTLMPLPQTCELLWFSERSGWAHLYLYDLETGNLKHPVTQGNWLVRDIVSFDASRREVFIQTGNRVASRDSYYRDLVRVNIDTGELTTLASSDHEYWAVSQYNHNTQMMRDLIGSISTATGSISGTGDFAVVTRSRADEAPVSLLLDRNGNEILEVEAADISSLPDGWRWPEPVKLLAADGKTDIYGLMFRPSGFSQEQTYPVISHLFSTPDFPWASKGSFSNGVLLGWPYLDAAALAELGFIVVQIDGRGVSYSSKAFQDESYGRVESASTLDDHIVGIQQLAERYPYMDLDRVGITTHLGGGPGAVQGLLQYPEFYKVGVSGFLHDSRLMPSLWGEKYEGISGSVGESSRFPNNRYQYPEDMAGNLKGKLLLMQGMLDTTNPPASMFRVIEALQKANKDFEMILLPNFGHGVSDYLIRRAWDYLVTYLLRDDPPKEFTLTTSFGGWTDDLS